ncbi:hypothetical protein SBF1_8000003 [Candidatus Desulfosporosinus infrequens]|uniref:Uncharacterized protein n=1 Tax=Candidatus Desulfosporosinus infrequens TaxID=2043169 RepID=A0A2U3LTM2_9FIRM|nr:hypothetical protein SBF1_8000003 [Candidatus Desulfosporosinus infrequens]
MVRTSPAIIGIHSSKPIHVSRLDEKYIFTLPLLFLPTFQPKIPPIWIVRMCLK